MKEPTAQARQSDADERAAIRHRWTAKPPGDSDEAQAGALLRSAMVVPPFGAKDLAEVAARLRGRERRSSRKWAWQLAIAMGLLLIGGAVSAAVAHFLRGPSVPAISRPAPVSLLTPAPVRRTHAAPPSPPAPAASPAPEPPPVARPVAPGPEIQAPRLAYAEGRVGSTVARSSLEPPAMAPASPSSLAQESRLIAGAIHKLRQDGDPAQALAMLDQHRVRFAGNGALEREANVTRIEALLRLGRHDEALGLLDAQVLKATGVGREMLVARAELRAEKGRRGAALNDFNSLLTADAPSDSVTERALFGRATCRAQRGDGAGARSDLEHYLARFPKGRFADQARAAIGK
jgi:hypothetical protein